LKSTHTMINLKNDLLQVIIFFVIACGCREIAVPKPKGYFRIDLPEHNYISLNDTLARINKLPLSFEYPSYGNLSFEPDSYTGPGWFNIPGPDGSI